MGLRSQCRLNRRRVSPATTGCTTPAETPVHEFGTSRGGATPASIATQRSDFLDRFYGRREALAAGRPAHVQA
jgi:hypothetical protein